MKIKHFSGYGLVTATKLSKTTITDMFGDKGTQLKVKVVGNHERGLERDDSYDLYNWLIKRFDKKVQDYHRISIYLRYTMKSYYENGVECCEYEFIYPNT